MTLTEDSRPFLESLKRNRLADLGGKQSWFFCFGMGSTAGFAPPDPRTVSIVSPVEVNDAWSHHVGERGLGRGIREDRQPSKSGELRRVAESHQKTKDVGARNRALDRRSANEVIP